MYIDHSLYPDVENPPTELVTEFDRADYLHRVCAAWDHRIHPEPETFELLSTWREIFDQFPLRLSPAYHAFRAWYRWPPVEVPCGMLGPRPLYEMLDEAEGREPDPCRELI